MRPEPGPLTAPTTLHNSPSSPSSSILTSPKFELDRNRPLIYFLHSPEVRPSKHAGAFRILTKTPNFAWVFFSAANAFLLIARIYPNPNPRILFSCYVGLNMPFLFVSSLNFSGFLLFSPFLLDRFGDELAPFCFYRSQRVF